VTTDPALYARVAQFYAQEASLLDDRLLYEWVDLFSDEVRYRIHALERHQASSGRAPVLRNRPVLLFEDDKAFLRKRAERVLDTGFAHAERPPSVSRHLITNILIEDDAGSPHTVRSSFVVFQARLEKDRASFFGSRVDQLDVTDDEIRIAGRDVVLDQFVLDRSVTILF
jgi:3-phenylpropionate/cinnamic acid dioxygenase small subunit